MTLAPADVAPPADPPSSRAGRPPVRRPDAVRRPPGAHRGGHHVLRPGLQLLPVPAAARRPDRALHPRPEHGPRAAARAAPEPQRADRPPVRRVPEEPVLHRRRLHPVLPAGVGRDRRLRRADDGAAAHRDRAVRRLRDRDRHQGRLEARQPLRPHQHRRRPSRSTPCRSSGSAWCCSSCSAPASGRSRASSRAAGPSRRGWTRPRSRACSTGPGTSSCRLPRSPWPTSRSTRW